MERIFKSKYKTISGIIPPLLAILLVAGIASATYYQKTHNIPITIIIGIAICSFVVLLMFKSPDYIVTEDAVLLKRGDKILKKLPYKDYLMECYTERVGFVPILYKYFLSFDDDKEERQMLVALSKEQFNAFSDCITQHATKVRKRPE